MWIGSGRIVLEYFNNEKLALKKRQNEILFKELKKQFSISIHEVAEFDDPERCVIGFSAVMSEDWSRAKARDLLRAICDFIDGHAAARVIDENIELTCIEEVRVKRP